MRIKGELGSGKDLEQTTMLPPGATNQSGGALPPPAGSSVTPLVTSPFAPPGGLPTNPFTLSEQAPATGPTFKPFGTPPKTPVNLLGEVEKWGINPATTVSNVNLNVSQMTGAQLNELLKKPPGAATRFIKPEHAARNCRATPHLSPRRLVSANGRRSKTTTRGWPIT